MRQFINSIGLGLALAIGTLAATAVVHPTTAHAQDYYIDYNDFYEGLSPYGDWFQDPEYGYVWMPRNVGPNFRPYYTNGNWTMTEYGNMWMSNYDWGWAPFNYGRWALRPFGWIWVPGTEWAPAWVVWREGGGYYGWAPMAPGVQMNNYFNSYNTPYEWFTFVPYRNIYNRNFNVYYMPNNFYNRHWNRTQYIRNQYNNPYYNNSYFWTGPSYNDVRRYNNNVQVNRITRTNTQGGPRIEGNNVRVYNPSIRNTNNANARPREVRDINTVNNARATNTGAIRNSNTTIQTNNGVRNTTNTRTTEVRSDVNATVPVRNTNTRTNEVRNVNTTNSNATRNVNITPVRNTNTRNVNTTAPSNTTIQRNNTITAPRNTNTRSTTTESVTPARGTQSAPRTSDGGGTLRR